MVREHIEDRTEGLTQALRNRHASADTGALRVFDAAMGGRNEDELGDGIVGEGGATDTARTREVVIFDRRITALETFEALEAIAMALGLRPEMTAFAMKRVVITESVTASAVTYGITVHH